MSGQVLNTSKLGRDARIIHRRNPFSSEICTFGHELPLPYPSDPLLTPRSSLLALREWTRQLDFGMSLKCLLYPSTGWPNQDFVPETDKTLTLYLTFYMLISKLGKQAWFQYKKRSEPACPYFCRADAMRMSSLSLTVARLGGAAAELRIRPRRKGETEEGRKGALNSVDFYAKCQVFVWPTD